MQVGDRFVLNVLRQDNHQQLMRHFLKRFPPGADRFAGVKLAWLTQLATMALRRCDSPSPWLAVTT